MDGLAETTNSCPALDDDGRLVVWDLTLWLGVDSNQVQVAPDLVHKLVEVPPINGRYWHIMWIFVDDVELLNSDLIDFVKNIDTWHINSISFNHINEFIHGGIASEMDIGI